MNTLNWNSQERVNAPVYIISGYQVPQLIDINGNVLKSTKEHWFMADDLATLILDEIARNWWNVFNKNKANSKDKLAKFGNGGLEHMHGSPYPSLRDIHTYSKEAIVKWCTIRHTGRNALETDEMLLGAYNKAVTSRLSWLNHLMVTRVSCNTGVTEFCKIYHSNAIHVLDYNKGGWLEPVPITEAPVGMQLSKPSQLKKGIYSTMHVEFFGDIDSFKEPKRLKLVAGPDVDCEKSPMPATYIISDLEMGEKWALGPIWVSISFANSWKILGRDGELYPIQTGDKLVGAFPNGTLAKGTAIVCDITEDMVISNDACKGKCIFNDLTRLHIQSRAAERQTVGGWINVSYQLGQFMPRLTKARIVAQLGLPRKSIEEVHGIKIDGAYTPLPSAKNMVEGKFTYMEAASLFKYPVFEVATEEDDNVKRVASIEISSVGANIINNESIEGFEEQVQDKIIDLLIDTIAFPCRGAWAVAVPLRGWTKHDYPIKGIDDWISMPEDMWVRLGKPLVIALTRYPIKGLVSLIKFNVRTHTDNACIEVSPLAEIVGFSGDFDGDQVAAHVDQDLVSQSTSIFEAYIACLSAQWTVKKSEDTPADAIGVSDECRKVSDDIPKFPTVDKDGKNLYTSAEASFKLLKMDTMGMATVCRDMLISKLNDNELLAIFEWIVQPGIAGKEGTPYLSPFKNEIGGMIGGRWIATKLPFIKKYLDKKSRLVSKPSLPLLMCSGNWYKDEDGKGKKPHLKRYIEVAGICNEYVNEGSTNPHNIIISAFSSLKYGFKS